MMSVLHAVFLPWHQVYSARVGFRYDELSSVFCSNPTYFYYVETNGGPRHFSGKDGYATDFQLWDCTLLPHISNLLMPTSRVILMIICFCNSDNLRCPLVMSSQLIFFRLSNHPYFCCNCTNVFTIIFFRLLSLMKLGGVWSKLIRRVRFITDKAWNFHARRWRKLCLAK